MANTQAKFGFRHIGYLGGGSPDFQLSTGLIASANTTKIFRGDPVVRDVSTGKVQQGADNTTVLVGIFDGCMYQPNASVPPVWSPYWPGAGAVSDPVAYIIDAPNAVFMAAALNTSIVTANIGENVGYAIGSGNTATGVSAATVDQSTLNTTLTLPFRVIAPVATAGNYGQVGNGSDPSTAYGWCIVAFNSQNYKTQTGLA